MMEAGQRMKISQRTRNRWNDGSRPKDENQSKDENRSNDGSRPKDENQSKDEEPVE